MGADSVLSLVLDMEYDRVAKGGEVLTRGRVESGFGGVLSRDKGGSLASKELWSIWQGAMIEVGHACGHRVCEPDTMAPFLKTLISRIVFGQQPRSTSPPRPKEPYIKFSNADFPGTVSSDSSYEDLQVQPHPRFLVGERLTFGHAEPEEWGWWSMGIWGKV